MARVFLSYDRRDARTAEQLASTLTEQGHQVWWDRSIKGGRRFSDEIEQALEQAEAVVVLWSSHAVTSDWVKDEAGAGRDTGRFVPLTLDGSLPPLGFRQYQTIDLSRMADPDVGPAVNDAIRALAEPDAIASYRTATRRGFSRRATIVGIGGAAAIVLSGAAAWRFERARSTANPEVSALLDQAWQAWAQGTSEGNSQAIGLYRRAASIAPGYADAWGFLGCAYGDRGHAWVTGAERDGVWERARAAGRRALQLEPANAYGRAAIAYARPRRGNWALMEREFRRAERDQPGKWLIVYSLALLLGEVGRFAEAARLFGSLTKTAPTATQYLWNIESLWASGQLDEAERLLDEAAQIYGSSPRIWWQRFDMLLHDGRASAAISLAEDAQSRPKGVDGTALDTAVAVARASLSRNAAEIATQMQALLAEARNSEALAGRAIRYANLLGETDAALAMADALYLSRGFAIPDFSATPGNAPQVTLDERSTRLLFLPPSRPMWQHARFRSLLGDLGLAAYWSETGTVADYRRA